MTGYCDKSRNGLVSHTKTNHGEVPTGTSSGVKSQEMVVKEQFQSSPPFQSAVTFDRMCREGVDVSVGTDGVSVLNMPRRRRTLLITG